MPASYSLNTSPLSWVELPVAPLFGSDFESSGEKDIVHPTDGGQRWIYRQFTRKEWELRFLFKTSAEKAAFQALHDLVDGALTPFWFKVEHDILGTFTLYCRKESNFNPQMRTTSGRPPFYDYSMTLTEELEAEEF